MVRLEEVLDFPAAEVHPVVTKAAFNAALLIKIQLLTGSTLFTSPKATGERKLLAKGLPAFLTRVQPEAD